MIDYNKNFNCELNFIHKLVFTTNERPNQSINSKSLTPIQFTQSQKQKYQLCQSFGTAYVSNRTNIDYQEV